jgi:hypothetical protein
MSAPLPSELGWARWQGSTLSQRLLPHRVRQEGHSVVRVPRALRALFLDMATVFLLYDVCVHKPKRPLSEEQHAAFRTWSEATKGLMAALGKETS